MIIMNDIQKKIREELQSIENSKAAKKTDSQLAAEENWKNDVDLQNRRKKALKENVDKISEASKTNWKSKEYREKRKKSLAEANARPEVKEKRKASSAKIHSTLEYKEKHRKGLEELRNDPKRWAEYQKKYNKGNSKKYDNPEYWENYYAGIAKRDADEEYTKKRLDASRAKICRKVQTPLGIFNSITEAATAHGMGNTETMRNRLKSLNFPDYILLDDKK